MIDLLFILVHILIVLFYDLKPKSLLLDARGLGYPECFQYLKYLILMGLAIYLFYLKKWYLYKLLFLLFASFLIDDIFQLHHVASRFFSNLFGLYSEFDNVVLSVGQLIYALVVILFFLGLSLWFYKSTPSKVQKVFLNVFLLLSFFLFFGIGVDVLHLFFKEQEKASIVLTIIEEGGEMLTLSILVWYLSCLVMKSKILQYNRLFTEHVNQ